MAAPLSRNVLRRGAVFDSFKLSLGAGVARNLNAHFETSRASCVYSCCAMSPSNLKMFSSSTSTMSTKARSRRLSPVLRISSGPPSKTTYNLNLSTSTTSSTLARRIPPDSWDSHMHVVGDLKSYPLAPGAAYVPHQHLLSDAISFENSVSLRNIVLVQPSIYGNDNSCLLHALKILGPAHGRGVVGFDPDTISQSTLQEWHGLGVRGVRVNLKSVGKAVVASELKADLRKYADKIRPLGWVLQLWIGLESMPVLESIVPELGVKVCVDHLGGPTIPKSFLTANKADPYSLPGFLSLVKLLEKGSTYVKLSAPYRLTNDAKENDIEPLAKEILRVAGMTSVVFATDWPHTRFDGLDIKPFMERCLDWCGSDEALVERLFRGNAEDLWSVQR